MRTEAEVIDAPEFVSSVNIAKGSYHGDQGVKKCHISYLCAAEGRFLGGG